MATSTVTIDKVYFETLLRRAQFHTSGVDFTTPVNLPTVTIPKLDHDKLLNVAREYANLRRNLYKGGVTDETLAILINDEASNADHHDVTTTITGEEDTPNSAAFMSQRPHSSALATPSSRTNGLDHTYGRNNNYLSHGNGHGNGHGMAGYNNHGNMIDDFSIGLHANDGFYNNSNGYGGRSRGEQFQKNAKRSVQLSNLAEAVTHADIVDAVRGGMLLDIYLRSNDRIAQVSFLEENDAKDFFHHSKRNDLYIRGKRVEISWAERQFILPNHVANKVSMGATRNLVIHNITPRHTEETIRDDLEHIHNLVVIRVSFKNRNCHIETNSIHNAMFARTCLMSRTIYKGCKIDWDADGCAFPITKVKPALVPKENIAAKKSAPINRFELLNIDQLEDDSDVERDTSRSTLQTAVSSTTGGVAF